MGGSVCEQRARGLTGTLHRELRDRGFRKRGTWLRCTLAAEPIGVVHVVGIQLTQGSTNRDCRGYINVGAGLVGLPARSVDLERVRVQDCLWTERLGDHWDLDDDLDDLAAEIGELARAWFEPREQADTLLAPFVDRDPSTVRAWLGQVEPVAAALVVRGEGERARQLLFAKRACLEDAGRPAQVVAEIDALARALGLTTADAQ